MAIRQSDIGRLSLRDQQDLLEKAAAAFRNRHIGFVFQDHCLLPQCSVLENVLAPTLVARSGTPDEYMTRARELLASLSLADKAGAKPIPVRFIGVGEGLEDLRPFKAAEFVSALLDQTQT